MVSKNSLENHINLIALLNEIIIDTEYFQQFKNITDKTLKENKRNQAMLYQFVATLYIKLPFLILPDMNKDKVSIDLDHITKLEEYKIIYRHFDDNYISNLFNLQRIENHDPVQNVAYNQLKYCGDNQEITGITQDVENFLEAIKILYSKDKIEVE